MLLGSHSFFFFLGGGETFERSLNVTFHVLIPKKVWANNIRGNLYKLLENRLKKVIGKVVSKHQNTFMEGRQIFNDAPVSNNPIDSRSKNLRLGVVTNYMLRKLMTM